MGDRLSSFADYSGKIQLVFALMVAFIIVMAIVVPRLLARKVRNIKN